MKPTTPAPWCWWWVYAAIRHINRNVDDGEMFLREEDKKLVDAGRLHTPNVRTNEGDVDLITAAPELLAACEAAANWVHDPTDPIGHFERLAEEFHRETGFLRPGKDSAAAAHQDPTACDIAWNEWRVARGKKVSADLRAAIKKARGE